MMNEDFKDFKAFNVKFGQMYYYKFKLRKGIIIIVEMN
jgi:hypothetical protein